MKQARRITVTHPLSRYCFILTCLYSIVGAHSASAQDQIKNEQSVSNELMQKEVAVKDIVILGERGKEFYDISTVDLANHTGFSRKISRDSFSHRLTQASELISSNSNIQVKKIGGLGSFSSLSIRGSGFNQANIFLDGILLNDAQYGSADINLIPSALIQSIEIFPDVTPIQFGNASLAGAINIRTLETQPEKFLRGSVGFGSFNTGKADITYADVLAGWNTVLAFSHIRSDNDFEYENTQGKRFIQDSTRLETQQNAEYAKNTTIAKFNKQLNQSSNIELLGIYLDTNNDVPTLSNSVENSASNDQKNVRAVVKYNNNFSNWSMSQQLRLNHQTSVFNNSPRVVSTKEGIFSSEGKSASLFSALETGLYAGTLSFTAEMTKEKYEDIELLQRSDQVDSERKLAVLAVQYNHWLFNDALQTSTAVRRYHGNNEALKISSSRIEGNIDSEESIRSSAWQQGFTYHFHSQSDNNFAIKFNIGQQVRLPTLFELFGNQNGVLGAPDLETEESANVDFGFQWRSTATEYGIAVFNKEVDNGIYLQVDANGTGKYKNITRSRISGIELESSFHLTNNLILRLFASTLDTENKSPIKAINGKQIQGLFHNSVRSSIVWTHAQLFTLQFDYSWNTDFFYDEANTPVQGGRDTQINADISLLVPFGKSSIDISIRNLTNAQQFDFDRYPSPGRSLFFTATHQL